MSVEAMLAVQRLTVRTSHAEYRVLMTLAEHADKTGANAWPALDTIATKAQTDEKSVRRCLHALERLQLITGNRQRGRGYVTVWTLNLPIPPLRKEGVTPGIIRQKKEGAMPGIRPVKGGVMPSLMASPQKEGMTPAILENCKVLQHVSDNTLIRCQTDKEGLAPYEPKKERKKEETETVRFAHSLTSSDARVIDPQPKTSFENFWAAYPRRVGRASAAKAYASAIRRIDPDSLLTAVTAYCWHVDMRFIPHAATWLNGDRWLDDARAAAPAPSLSQPVNSRRMTNEEKCDALFGPSPFLQAWQSRPLTPERQHHDEATHHTIEHDFFAG